MEKQEAAKGQADELEALIQKATDMGITFISGPATHQTAADPGAFHVVEGMTDDTFREALERKIEAMESTRHVRILERLGILKSPPASKPIRETFTGA
jgi:hypothetical protein